MENPFQTIEERLNNIENLILSLNRNQVESNSQSDKEELLTVQEAAQFLKLSVPTIYSKVSNGELPVMKRSKRLYFSSIELMEYVRKGRNMTTEEAAKEADEYLKRRRKS